MITRVIFALGALLSLSAATQPAPVQTSADPAAAARIRAHVEFLADDLLEGRDTGSRGYDIAAAYVASQFRGLGLQPAGEKGSWFQPVTFRTATVTGSAPVVELIGNGGRGVALGKQILVGASSQEKQQDLTAHLVFVGYGISDPALKMDDYAGVDVRGKIVVTLFGTPDGLPTEVAAHIQSAKAEMAAKHGAVGLIQVPTRAAQRSAIWGYIVQSGSQPVTTWVDPQGQAGTTGAKLRFSITAPEAAASALFTGGGRTFAQIQEEAARTGHRPKGFALPRQLHFSRTSAWSESTSAEVIGLLPGTDPQLKNEYVVLMGHLDHLGIDKDAKPGTDAIRNGALDNAAGVATMLEAAHEFVESGKPPRRSVLFIANTGEEKGLLGADYYAAHPTVPIQQIVSVVDLDMPLLLYDFTDIVAFGADHSTVARNVAQAAQSMGVTLSDDPMPEQSIFVRSDHYQFVKRGVPAILLFTGYANGGKQIWDKWLPSIYHSPQDDVTQNINWNAGARYAEVNYRISRALADADTRALWYEGDYFGEVFAPGQPRAKR